MLLASLARKRAHWASGQWLVRQWPSNYNVKILSANTYEEFSGQLWHGVPPKQNEIPWSSRIGKQSMTVRSIPESGHSDRFNSIKIKALELSLYWSEKLLSYCKGKISFENSWMVLVTKLSFSGEYLPSDIDCGLPSKTHGTFSVDSWSWIVLVETQLEASTLKSADYCFDKVFHSSDTSGISQVEIWWSNRLLFSCSSVICLNKLLDGRCEHPWPNVSKFYRAFLLFNKYELCSSIPEDC